MVFDVAAVLPLGERTLSVRFTAGAGLTALFGRSGAGKTSILDMIAGVRAPAAGHIAVTGRTLFDAARGFAVPIADRHAGYVFQEPRLFPHRRVRDNLTYARPRNAAIIGFDALVAMLDIGHLLDRWPRHLSGGEARRVAIGRALLSAPAFLLMDEPLAALDQARRDEVMTAIERIRDTLAIPILYVSHDPAEVARLATRRIEMEDIAVFSAGGDGPVAPP